MTIQLILILNALAAILLLITLTATMRIPYRLPGPLGASPPETSEQRDAARPRQASPSGGRHRSRSATRQPVADTT
jgi:hypothetical protein